MNFGPYILTLLKSPEAELQNVKNLSAKIQKLRRYCDKCRKVGLSLWGDYLLYPGEKFEI